MDIAAAILEISQEGAIRTNIMFRAFLSYPQLKEYLALLVEAGLLRYSEGEKMYYTIEKGRRFLKMYREVDAMIPTENMLTKIIHR